MKDRAITLVTTILLLGTSMAVASHDPDAVIGPTPPGALNCIAVEIETPPTGITGLRWFNNDSGQTFPRLVLVEGHPNHPPDLSTSGLVLLELTGTSLTWGEIDFGEPIVSSTGTAHAVIFFPEDSETTDIGAGGGPGIGVRLTGAGRPFYLSADATAWGRFDPSYELAVEAIVGLARARPRLLSEMDGIDLIASRIEDAKIPRRTALHRPSPNPFNPRVELAFSLAGPGRVTLAIYDVRGRRVRTLVEESYAAGNHTIEWNGEDDSGHHVASGVYFARFTGPDHSETHRMALIR